MKRLVILCLLINALSGLAQSPADYTFEGVPFNKVVLSDSFWLPKIEVNRTVTIPTSFQKCEETGRLRNFVLAAEKKDSFLTTYPFDDTDLYKIIEGASYSMTVHPDPALDRYVDSLIAIIGKAQEPDGYLYTARTINPARPHNWAGKERWVNESVLSHELYNSGHLFEAASAHFIATGKHNLLNIALKNADLLVQVFGPGKRNDAPGHEIVEMGLVRLYRITGEKKYLDLARFFIDCRGKNPDPESYSQDHIPFIQQDEAVGHAVRAGYLYAGAADVAALTGDPKYLAAVDRLWNNVVTKKLYLTGGVGAKKQGESFGGEYDLPNLTAYNETCAAIANVYWNYRMFLLHGESKYIDVLERSLYNNVISGVGADGRSFFYTNPLACDASYAFNEKSVTRQPWFSCSCCPTNLCRFLPSVPGYIYAKRNRDVYVNLFIASQTRIPLPDSSVLGLEMETAYPWSGIVKITVTTATPNPLKVLIRIPGWAGNSPVPGDLYAYLKPETHKIDIRLNGMAIRFAEVNGFAVIERTWMTGDVLEFELPMEPHLVTANPLVTADSGKVAIERGPLVYCLEETDNPNGFNRIVLTEHSQLATAFNPDLLGGISVISGNFATSDSLQNGDILFKEYHAKAIPYYSWNNRGVSRMNVWIPLKGDQSPKLP